MNINDFQNLSREEQFAEAGRIAGTEPSVFDGVWRTESGRGVNMNSPAGAKGHFGLMDGTRKTWEGRFGASIDPYNFGQSLFTAAHTLKENLGRFGNLPDALRAYNGGWNPKTWGNAETAAYAGKVLGSDGAPAAVPDPEDHPAGKGPAAGAPTRGATQLWDVPFERAGRAGKPAPANKLVAAEAVGAMAPKPQGPPTFDITNGIADAAVGRQDAKRKLAEDTSFLDTARAASNGEMFHQMARLVFRDPEPITEGFKAPESVMKGKLEWQQRQLRAAGSQKELDRLLFEQQDASDQQEIVFRNGTLFGVGATMLAELPSAAFTGGITSLGFGAMGIGAIQLARAGHKLSAVASSLGEGVAGNVLGTAALDAMGQHQGAEQYAFAAAGGILNPILQGKALGRTADKALEMQAAVRIAQEAVAKKVKLAKAAEKNLGAHASPEELAAEMKRLESEGIRADVASHKAAVPESRRFNVGDEADLVEHGIVPPEQPPLKASTSEALQPDDATPNGWGSISGNPAPTPFKNNAEAVQAVDALDPKQGMGFRAERWFDPTINAKIVEQLNDPVLGADGRAVWSKQTQGYTWEQFQKQKATHYESPELKAAMAADPKLAESIKTAQAIAEEYLPNTKFTWSTAVHGSEGASVLSMGRAHAISINPAHAAGATTHLTHEIGHAVFHQYASKASPRVRQMIADDWVKFVNDVRAGKNEAWNKRFSVANPWGPRGASDMAFSTTKPYALSKDEMMAEQFVTHIQSRIEKGDFGQLSEPAKTGLIEAFSKLWSYFKDAMAKGLLRSDGAEAFFSEVLRTSRMKNVKDAEKAIARAKAAATPEPVVIEPSMSQAPTAQQRVTAERVALMQDPIAQKYGLDLMPSDTPAQRGIFKQVISVYRRADAWAAVNPIDEKRLNKLMANTAFDPTSNMMLRSENPVVRMVASELLENGGGAAGRRSSAAVAKFMNERAINGNVVNELDDAFNLWHKGQPGADRAREFLTGQRRVEFNRLVAEEIEQRRYPAQQTDLGEAVRAAADSVEGVFERARLMQIDAKTVGWGALPESSRGYMPHRMRPDVVRSLTNAQRRALHGALTDQFVGISGFDMSFADHLASKYIDRIQRRALGGFDAPTGLHQPGAADVVRDALDQMGLTRDEIDASMKRYVAGGAGHTKKRLNLDLRQQFTNDDGTTFRLMDLFDTDMLSLVRGQSQRVSGEVALTRHGVMGKPGLQVLKEAMMAGPGTTKAQIEAFDQVSAEFLGSPFGTQNKWVDRAMQANAVASLGGMGFNQLGELINVGTTLGVKSALSNISGFFRLRSEIKALAKGTAVNNPIIGSLEKFGGAEFGTDAYKMVFPMDLPDAPIHTMGADTLHFSDRLLRGAGHVQSKLSGWRAINSVQQRGVAEQVVHHAARILRDGGNNVNMRDMGLSDEVFNRLRTDLPNIANFQGGHLVSFDITKATDVDAAMQFVQAVHRGTGQMIQGTFIGETGKYVHNSYLRLLTQFRGFSITSVDKQWNRQAGNNGVAKALGITVGAMSVAAPLYMARTYLASIGRHDQDEYLDRMLAPGAIARATTNYIATSGFAGDVLDAFTSVTGTGEMTGGRSGTNTQLIGNLVAPALGKADKVWGALQNTKDGTDVHGLIRELPLSRLPWFIPAINALGN